MPFHVTSNELRGCRTPCMKPQSLLTSIKTLISQNHHPHALKLSLSLSLSLPLFPPFLTDQTYALFLKSGHSLHPILSTTLISHFTKNGDFSRSFRYLLDTHIPDTIAFNALISGYAAFARTYPCFALFNHLRDLGLCPDVYTFSSLVKSCDSIEKNEIVHGVCLKYGFGSSAFVVSGLVENYSNDGDIVSAEKCFEKCEGLGMDCVVWSAMVSGYVWNEEFEMAKRSFRKMREWGLGVNDFSLTAVVGAVFDSREGGAVHGFGVKTGLLSGGCSKHLNNAVMSMYTRCGCKSDAVLVFDEIPDPDVVSWSERIAAACDVVEAFELFKVMHSSNVEFNEFTVINLLCGVDDLEFLESGKQIQALCLKKGLLQFASVSNAFISMYGKCGQIISARQIFDAIDFQDAVSWNSLIGAYVLNGLLGQSLSLFCLIPHHLMLPNMYTMMSILEGVSNSNSLDLAMQVHSQMIRLGFVSEALLFSSLITTYGKCNGAYESEKLFLEIDDVGLDHLNAMLASFVQTDCHVDALNLFQSMQSVRLILDSSTISTILKACTALTDLEQARVMHAISIRYGLDQDNYVESALLDAYCKCGNIRDAEKAFSNVSVDNLVAWNAMMMGYAQNGHSFEALKLFEIMGESGMIPDEITYLAVLTSCCHSGLVEEGYFYMNSMYELHGLVPTLEHYACMVDLLGRVGKLEDAKRMIDEMPFQPDAQIWQILLSVCTIHGDVDLANIAARKLVDIQPGNDSAYILLSNLHASVGNWLAVRKLRREMKEKMLWKEPGSSWVQVQGVINFFLANDNSHPENENIFIKLNELYGHMLPQSELEEDCAAVVDF